jgi:hypothetical protein
MTHTNGLEQRVVELERLVQELRRTIGDKREPNDWQRTVGMFAGDTVMKRIDEAGRKIREADRAKARRASKRAGRRALRPTAAKMRQSKPA